MTPKTFKLQAVHTMIFLVRELHPSPELLSEWREHISTLAVFFLKDQPEKAKKDLKEITDHVSRLENAKAATLRKAVRSLDPPLKKTVVVSDDPMAVRYVRQVKAAMQIGIKQGEDPLRKFYENGASVVLDTLDHMEVSGTTGEAESVIFTQTLPQVFSRLEKFNLLFGEKRPFFFFDYDGTLSPIVRDPSRAVISERMRTLLRQLSQQEKVAIVSGRDMNDIKGFIGLDNLIYAGSHGFRISGPGDLYKEHDSASRLLPALDEMEQELRETLEKRIHGVEVERKYFAIAVHYRNAPPAKREVVRRTTRSLARKSEDFKTGRGKMLIEIKPAMEWHKGRALEWLIGTFEKSMEEKFLPVYIGDDLTDEDAFRTIADEGVGILVGTHAIPSAAHYQLDDVEQVEKFIHYLVQSG